MWFILISFIGVIGYFYLDSLKHQQATTPRLVDISKMFHWPSAGDYEFEVVGESFYQNAIESIIKNKSNNIHQEFVAVITPYSTNKYDDKAVKVEIDGLIVGHLSKEDARSFRRRLGTKKLTNQATAAKAMIIGGHNDKAGNKLSYGVALDIKPFNN